VGVITNSYDPTSSEEIIRASFLPINLLNKVFLESLEITFILTGILGRFEAKNNVSPLLLTKISAENVIEERSKRKEREIFL
jgi:hypothetical protein